MSSGNDPDAAIEYWSALQKFGRDLVSDANLAAQFRTDPATIIRVPPRFLLKYPLSSPPM